MNKTVFTILTLLLTGLLSSGQRTFPSGEEFKNPVLNYYPHPLWFWNDTQVTSEIVEQQ